MLAPSDRRPREGGVGGGVRSGAQGQERGERGGRSEDEEGSLWGLTSEAPVGPVACVPEPGVFRSHSQGGIPSGSIPKPTLGAS